MPALWGIALPAGPLPAGVACTIQASVHAMRCTRATLPASTGWDVDATITPPAGTGTGTVTLAVTTTSAEIGVYPNVATIDIAFRPGGDTRTITVAPNTGLADGDTVTVSGTNFGARSSIAMCEGIISPSLCGGPVHTTTADVNGHFQTTMGVDRFLVVVGVGVIDCAQPQSSCGIGALDLTNGGNTAIKPIAFTPQPPVDDPFNARIIGRVTDTNGSPVAGAPVWAYRATDGWVGSVRTTTDQNGNYVLEDAEPGISYRLVFGAPPGSGLVAEWYGGPASGGSPTRANAFDVTLSANTPVVTANAALAAGGSITGTVVDATGAPVAHVVVWAYRNDNVYVGSYAIATAGDGTYRIAGIQPNTPLRLRFVPAAASGLRSEWFDNSPTRAGATPISVTAGATVTADARLDALP